MPEFGVLRSHFAGTKKVLVVADSSNFSFSTEERRKYL